VVPAAARRRRSSCVADLEYDPTARIVAEEGYVGPSPALPAASRPQPIAGARMLVPDVKQLYDEVKVGTAVFVQ
jgi:hypothetical protein